MATISHKDIAKAIYLGTVGKTGAELGNAISESVKVLARRNLLGRSENILEALDKLINKETGIVEAEAWGSSQLAGDAKRQLEAMLKKRYGEKEFKIKEHIDTSLLGGWKIKVGDEMMDLTVKNKIKKLEEYLTR